MAFSYSNKRKEWVELRKGNTFPTL